MGKVIALALLVSLVFSGCGWLDGSHLSVTPHREQRQTSQSNVLEAADYPQLLDALTKLVAEGTESAAIHVENYPEGMIERGMRQAVRYLVNYDSIGAFALERIQYELGTSGGHDAVAVELIYRRSKTEIRQIQTVKDTAAAENKIKNALSDCEPGAVLLVENYESRDFTQFVQNYASEYPQAVMEIPQVTESVYGSGDTRVVELIFSYQNSRESLRQMRSQVEPVFNAAVLYVSGDGEDRQKLSQLYAFLMERFDYNYDTSITPAYSLLRHGVGDSKAFATVYAAMCRAAGLECMTVTGTCAGQPRTWNLVRQGEYYFHVDLLRCNELGGYRAYTDGEMEGYVWDYSAYPACDWVEALEETASETEPEEIL